MSKILQISSLNDAYQNISEAKEKILNGSPLYEKDIERIAELAAKIALKKLAVSTDTSKAVLDIKELDKAIKGLGGE